MNNERRNVKTYLANKPPAHALVVNPCFVFQTGVYIIDSPGFGENAAMDKMLMDYISANQIFAFIYVIKSDNAGGVQEDRVNFLSHNSNSASRNMQ